MRAVLDVLRCAESRRRCIALSGKNGADLS